MENENTLGSKLTRIKTAVDRIKLKTDTTGDLIEDVATAVENMENVSGTINITSNDVYDVTNYASAEVNVPIQYVTGPHIDYVLEPSGWNGSQNNYNIQLQNSSYTYDINKIQLGIPRDSTIQNTNAIIGSGIYISEISSGGSYISVTIYCAIGVPSIPVTISLFNVEAK